MNERRQAIDEIGRELNVRRNVYPRLVMVGKLSQEEADRRTRALSYAIYFLDRPDDTNLSTGPITGE